MKTVLAAIVFAAALAAAEPQHALPTGTKINCAKPNANYCMGGDIILRCGSDATGQPGRCSDNVAGYPPSGGVAECWQSSQDAGDAACQKNCVVYASPSFTLPAAQCTPSFTQTGLPTSTSGSNTSTSTSGSASTSTTPTGSSSTGSQSTSTTVASSTTSSSTTSVTSISSPPTSTTTATHGHSGNSTTVQSTGTQSSGGIVTLTTTVGSPTKTPPSSNNAVANSAMGGLLGICLAAAALF
ncbi:hypothetical protein NQ176_g8803 [Zarea fungicola]|uniref:Uncharacterized protein n=1 Tax=Zarea fungicola TaxID=93591 RepID=A0ACC1MRA6_9HYPO|nr:hypothetical protein NQ176_g8803 [Lecanicillium fungicola]